LWPRIGYTQVDGRWSMVDGRWSMVDGRWSMVDGRWSMVASVAGLTLKGHGRDQTLKGQ